MKVTKIKKAPRTYKCDFCGLHYENKELASDCFEWCTAHGSCNLEITKNSIERRKKFAL